MTRIIRTFPPLTVAGFTKNRRTPREPANLENWCEVEVQVTETHRREIGSRQDELRDFWTCCDIVHQATGVKEEKAFIVYSDLDVDGADPFRTLIWKADILPDQSMAALASECFSAQLSDHQDLAPDAIATIGDISFSRRASSRSRERNSGWCTFTSAVTAREVDFLRINIPSRDELMALSCRALPDEAFELAILLTGGMSFSNQLLEWVVLHHRSKIFHDSEIIDVVDLKKLLNEGWRHGASLAQTS
jgi:hypothetical protein